MKKENAQKIQAVEKDAEKDIFESKYDPILRRVSYRADIRDHFFEELSFISGVLDLLYLVDDADQWENRREEVAFVMLDARNRARALYDVL